VAFSPDGKWLATGSADKTARVIEAATGREVYHLAHQGWVAEVAFSPDGKWLATGSSDKTARVMEAATGTEVYRLAHQGWVAEVAFSPDSRWVATRSADYTLRVMDAATGEELHRIQIDPARIIDAATGEEIRGLQIDVPRAMRFTPDLRFLEIWHADDTDLVLTRHPLHPDDLIREACQKVTRNLTVAEWRQYVGKETPYQRSCDNLPYPPDYGQR